MDIPLDEVLHFGAITSEASGAAADADSTPTWAVFEESTDTAIQTGNFTKRTSLDGHYRGTVTLSAANGFEVGKWYEIAAAATVDSVAGKAIVFGPFRIVPAEAQTGVPVVDIGYVDGTGVDPGEVADVNVVTIEGVDATDALATAASAAIAASDIATNTDLDALIATVGVAGAGLTAIQLPSNGLANITAWTVDVTGSLSGSVGSVTGAVGSVTGNVGGNVAGSVGSVTGAVGSVTAPVTAGTVTDKTGYALSATGLNLVVPADPSAIPVPGTATLVTWIGWFGAQSVNEWQSDADEARLRNTANNADLATYPHSDDGTTYNSDPAE